MLGQQAKDRLHLPEEKERKEIQEIRERERATVEQMGPVLPYDSPQRQELHTICILQMRNQGSKQASKSSPQLGSEGLSVKATS